ncbi:PilZ domain-containing protein [Altererythrobacter lutimaris]|uniref:PilZ domain-containing protein n=1 Tax=Altererythrobacter lutimaris TaxID=2743979 RepID=A0A850HI87_9SPHN|nr:PilZ domain-containing protein [Altererythrobacter lutimaris]NVE95142.1 PilZ domain-containing protein [Altererythrobacter lutimaris]
MKTRKTSRKELQALAGCRNSNGREWQSLLADVSDGGCKLLDPSEQIRKGERLHLYFANTGPHMVQATWRRGDQVGLEFRSPLSDELLQKLAAQDWSAIGAEIPDGAPGVEALRFV